MANSRSESGRISKAKGEKLEKEIVFAAQGELIGHTGVENRYGQSRKPKVDMIHGSDAISIKWRDHGWLTIGDHGKADFHKLWHDDNWNAAGDWIFKGICNKDTLVAFEKNQNRLLEFCFKTGHHFGDKYTANKIWKLHNDKPNEFTIHEYKIDDIINELIKCQWSPDENRSAPAIKLDSLLFTLKGQGRGDGLKIQMKESFLKNIDKIVHSLSKQERK